MRLTSGKDSSSMNKKDPGSKFLDEVSKGEDFLALN